MYIPVIYIHQKFLYVYIYMDLCTVFFHWENVVVIGTV